MTGGRRESENWPDSSTIHLPPSPILNRTVLSKIKDRDRFRLNIKSYLSNNNTNSANSSRRSTQDSIRIDEFSLSSPLDENCSMISGSSNSIEIPANSAKEMNQKWHLLFQKQQQEIELLNRKLKSLYQQKSRFQEQIVQWDKREGVLKDFIKSIQEFFNCNSNETGNLFDYEHSDCATLINQIKTCFDIFRKLYQKQNKEISDLKETIRLLESNDSCKFISFL